MFCKNGYYLNDDNMCVKKINDGEKTDETDVLPSISDDISDTISVISIETDISSTDSENHFGTEEYSDEESESSYSDIIR
jgi:hypothetical protein